jgi:hypothetical protein
MCERCRAAAGCGVSCRAYARAGLACVCVNLSCLVLSICIGVAVVAILGQALFLLVQSSGLCL